MTDSSRHPIAYDVDADGICTLTIDLPGHTMNVMGAELSGHFKARVEQAAADPAVKGVVVTSGKSSFFAGADLKEIGAGMNWGDRSKGEIAEAVLSFSFDLRRLETCGKPFACAVNGTALGAGFEIALACHYRVVADDPKILLGLPEANVGLLAAGGGTQRVIRLIGIQAGAPLLLQGKMISPQAALGYKLVDEVVPVAELVAVAKRWLLTRPSPVKPWDVKGFKLPGGGTSLDVDVRNFFAISNAMVRANGYGNYPAPEVTSCAIYEGAQLPMDLALRAEAKYFVELVTGPVSAALIRTMFVNKGKAEALTSRPKHVEKVVYKKIAVIGAGTMGAGIAYAAAKAGIEVVLIDRELAAAEKGKAYAASRLQRDIDKGRSTQEKADRILARIHPAVGYEGVAEAQLAIETVFEDRGVKGQVLPKVEAMLTEGAILASNTSAMPITGLAEFTRNPAKFIGMHFFSPADRMPLVELIRGRDTDDETWAKALDFVAAIRKTPITVNDSPGFFTSRFIGAFVGEGFNMINAGVKPALVENAARMVGMPMGPMTISDLMGLDVGYHAGMQMAKDRGDTDPQIGVSGVLYRDFGRTGVKSGKGFYDYGADGDKRLWPGLKELLPAEGPPVDVEEAKTRILYAQLAEGARCFAEGVLLEVIDGQLGATLGVGFPAYLGGPFMAMDTIGLRQVVAECDRLAGLYGKMFEIPQLLRDMAASGQTFHGEKAIASPGARRAA
jgi:3-hydroxyacyl-CoA dehydrogenase/enoyl-CoA hydratase/3-hydroxybutyryl-CoA epimerase